MQTILLISVLVVVGNVPVHVPLTRNLIHVLKMVPLQVNNCLLAYHNLIHFFLKIIAGITYIVHVCQ